MFNSQDLQIISLSTLPFNVEGGYVKQGNPQNYMYCSNTCYAGLTVSSLIYLFINNLKSTSCFFPWGKMEEVPDDSSINKPYSPKRLHIHHAMLVSAKEEIQLPKLLPKCCIISKNEQRLRRGLYKLCTEDHIGENVLYRFLNTIGSNWLNI